MKKISVLLLIAVSLMFSGCMGLDISKPDISICTYNSSITAGTMNEKYLDALKIVTDKALVSYFENSSVEEFEDDITTISSENHNLIFVPNSSAWEILSECASDYPEKHFAITDVYEESIPSNMTNIAYKYYEGAYLAGYVAGKTAKEKKLGILCEKEDIPTTEMIYAYAAGAVTAGGDIEFDIKYIGTEYNNNTAYDAATELYKNGSEIIFQNLSIPDGAINAANVADKFIIGVGVEQSVKSASHVLTSVVVNYDIALSKVLTDYLENPDSIKGKTYNYGMKDHIVSLSKTSTHIDKAVFSEVSKLKESIIKGGFDVPRTYEAVEALREEAIKNPPEEPVEDESEDTEETENKQ